jgi:AcrR family transcriptional regulator
VFLEVGYTGARVQEIAKRAGLTTGAIYANFAGKGELLAEALKRSSAADLRVIGETTAGRSMDDLERIVVEVLAAPAEPTHALMVEAWGVALHDSEDAESLRSSAQAMTTRTRACLEAAVGDGELATDVDLDALQLLLRAIVMGAIVAKATGLGTEVDRASAEALVARLFETVRTAH